MVSQHATHTHTHSNMSSNGPNQTKQIQPNCTRYRNAARASPLTGRHVPTKYTSPNDTNRLITKEEFMNRFIRDKAGNRYTDSDDIIEQPSPTSLISPTTPSSIAPTSASTTQRTETATSYGSDTSQDKVEHAPTGW